MPIFFLPSTIKKRDIYRLLNQFPRFLTIAEFIGSSHLMPYGYALVLITYSGTEKGHAWKNPYRRKEYNEHPLGLKDTDGSFFEDFYELTKIKALIDKPGREKWLFREGETWSVETYTMSFPIMKSDPNSVWNFLEQRYDQPCDNDTWECDISPRVSYGALVSDIRFLGNSLHEIFADDMTLFFKVYCKCCICEQCHKIHDYSCNMDAATSICVGAVLQSTKSTNMQELD